METFEICRYSHIEDILPVIGQLLQQSPTTSYAYLCHPAVDHISKLKREGQFCQAPFKLELCGSLTVMVSKAVSAVTETFRCYLPIS
jgi:hypothetical protein